MTKLKRKVRRMWWDIKDVAFVGTNITRKNGIFMSTANKIPVGSVYDLKKNIWGLLTDEDLVYSHSTLANNYNDFPKIINESANHPTKFKLDSSNEIGLEVLGSLVDTTNVGEIDTELSSMLKNTKEIVVNIKAWGIDYIEEGEISTFLTNRANSKDNRIKSILNRNNYFATRGIWIQGLSFDYEFDQEFIQKIKAIYESNKDKFIEAKLDFKFKSEFELEFDFDSGEKFYPFFKFRRIKSENKDDYYLASIDMPENDVFLDDVDFTELTA